MQFTPFIIALCLLAAVQADDLIQAPAVNFNFPWEQNSCQCSPRFDGEINICSGVDYCAGSGKCFCFEGRHATGSDRRRVLSRTVSTVGYYGIRIVFNLGWKNLDLNVNNDDELQLLVECQNREYLIKDFTSSQDDRTSNFRQSHDVRVAACENTDEFTVKWKFYGTQNRERVGINGIQIRGRKLDIIQAPAINFNTGWSVNSCQCSPRFDGEITICSGVDYCAGSGSCFCFEGRHATGSTRRRTLTRTLSTAGFDNIRVRFNLGTKGLELDGSDELKLSVICGGTEYTIKNYKGDDDNRLSDFGESYAVTQSRCQNQNSFKVRWRWFASRNRERAGVNAVQILGRSIHSHFKFDDDVSEAENKEIIWIAVSVGIVLLLGFLAFAAFMCIRKRRMKGDRQKLEGEIEEEQIDEEQIEEERINEEMSTTITL